VRQILDEQDPHPAMREGQEGFVWDVMENEDGESAHSQSDEEDKANEDDVLHDVNVDELISNCSETPNGSEIGELVDDEVEAPLDPIARASHEVHALLDLRENQKECYKQCMLTAQNFSVNPFYVELSGKVHVLSKIDGDVRANSDDAVHLRAQTMARTDRASKEILDEQERKKNLKAAKGQEHVKQLREKRDLETAKAATIRARMEEHVMEVERKKAHTLEVRTNKLNNEYAASFLVRRCLRAAIVLIILVVSSDCFNRVAQKLSKQ
jgi:hypothetical protein